MEEVVLPVSQPYEMEEVVLPAPLPYKVEEKKNFETNLLNFC